MRILIAYDGSPAAEAAVKQAAKTSWPAGAEVRLVTIVEWPMALEPPFPADFPGPAAERIREVMTEKGKQTLAQGRKAFLGRTNIEVSTDLRAGSPKHELLEAIESWKPDLVMCGSTGKTGLKRLLVGSVCHAIVTHAPCNVLIVKSPATIG